MGADLELGAAGATPPIPRLCRYLSERSPLPVVAVAGAAHAVEYVNPAFARLAGRAATDLVGRPLAEAVPEGAGNGCVAMLDRVFNTGATEHLAEQEHSSASPAYWSYSAWAILGADGRPAGAMVQVTDATEVVLFRRRLAAVNEALLLSSVRQHELVDAVRRGEQERRELEAQVFHAKKLESLGVLAGGIAHDLNNILTPVIGFAELAADALPADSPAAPMLSAVRLNARRAADLVRQILAYAGKGRFVVQPVDLSDLVREMRGLLGAGVSVDTELAFDLAPDLPPVEADATQLRQVVLNLVKNAAEAVGEGVGIITVRTGLVPAGLPSAGPSPLGGGPAGGPAVFLEVTDTGCGMTAEVVERIFDPFFTTKFTGRGLGLAVVQGIVRGHRGVLQVRSEPGRGSAFRLLLPCSATAAEPPPAARRPEGWRAAGTVLVIDDEAGVRDIAAGILRGAGLAVLAAGGGEEGLRVLRDHQPGVDAVVVDLTMPGMGGLDAARALRGLRPALPVVLMSGFSVSEVTLQSAGLGITGFVQKPFAGPDLLSAVRAALGQ